MDMIDSSNKDIICMVIRGHILGGDGEDFISDTWKDALKIFRGESSE